MTLVKLDSGDYINTEAVDTIKGGDDPYTGLRSNNAINITTTDRDRIVEAMTNPETELRKRIAGLIQQLNARIKELEYRTRPEDISDRLTLETIVQWMSEALDE